MDDNQKDIMIAGNGQILKENDYIDATTGLYMCGNCHTPIQCRHNVLGVEKILGCMCRCESESFQKKKEDMEVREHEIYLNRLRQVGLQDRSLKDCTFENDNGDNGQMYIAKNYVKNWDEMLSRGKGLLLWGNVGSGKTFMAACIANELGSHGVPFLVTNFSRLLNQMTDFSLENKNQLISELNNYKLLVIDDLGIERNTEYALEQIYSVIDARYLSGLPFIISTNLTLNQLKNPNDIAHARIYDRILERCQPVQVTTKNYRKEKTKMEQEDIKSLLTEKEENV